jgi:CHASE3 domain sensor protein
MIKLTNVLKGIVEGIYNEDDQSNMKSLYERQFIETMIRGTLGMLNDKQRMTDRDAALQFIFDRTGATTEDEIRPIMRTMSTDEVMDINVGVGRFISNYTS